ncbi:MAG: AraC family transcriptional regulator [Bacteroidales bacterium]|nr:AraC family transcriptional regulator [Bacteroidales bacterium]MBO7529994.1 AraC family transcriptional regulator [Bacteroidales bacterium]MBQ3844186.1 AraC family transcriptional regulator [Bacteroidales bacterium]
MNNQSYNKFSLSKVKELFLKDYIVGIGDDFILAHQTNNIDIQPLKFPSRIDGFIAAYCKKGRFKCTINLTEYDIHDGMLAVNTPNNIIQLEPLDDNNEFVEMTILAMSPQYMTKLGSDLNKIFMDALTVLKSPILEMAPEEVDIATQYLNLIDNVINTNSAYRDDSVRFLLASIFHLIGGILMKRLVAEEENSEKAASTHHKNVFKTFVQLVEKYHDKERSVGFYADKLCITPKYLSKIIKNVSGFSAPEIINKYVILEAQHLLRHTDLSIKEIADQLNFPNQSFFYKYFKSHTGCTPNYYRQK